MIMKRNCRLRCAFYFLSLYRLVFSLAVLLVVWSIGAAQNKTVVIAVEDDAAPWSRPDGSGYANDLVIAAFKAVNIDVDLKVVPYARCKRMAMNGEVVACFNTSPSADLAGSIELATKPLFTVNSAYFYNVKKPIRLTNEKQLPDKTVVGTVIGYEYPNSFEELKQRGVVVVEESPSEEVNLRKLAAGRIDLALLVFNEMKSASSLIKKAGVEGRVQMTIGAGTMKSYIGFSLKHPQGPWAREQFNQGFDRIIANGTFRRIRLNWLRIVK
jgi:ABC-type amino acid transport substrate-binding protein